MPEITAPGSLNKLCRYFNLSLIFLHPWQRDGYAQPWEASGGTLRAPEHRRERDAASVGCGLFPP